MSPPARDDLTVVLAQPAAWSPDGSTNLAVVDRALRAGGPLDASHVVVLPELAGATMDRAAYERAVGDLARASGAWVVGGSHYGTEGPMINGGVVVDPDGGVVDHYEKRNPYGVEHDHGVQAGERLATFHVGGRWISVLLCADMFFAELLLAGPRAVDLVIVPSFSITRRPPSFAGALWRHLAVARAYEFTAYVAIADWRRPAAYLGTPGAGVGGVADPFPTDAERYFTPAVDRTLSVHRLDLARLDGLRADRIARRFSRPTCPSDAARSGPIRRTGRVVTRVARRGGGRRSGGPCAGPARCG